jgi:IS30 family transposase
MGRDNYSTKVVKYKRLDREKRIKIECYLQDGVTQSEIARRIGVDKSTVSREIKRGSVGQKREIKVKPTFENYYTGGVGVEYYKAYFADTAQIRAEKEAEGHLKRSYALLEKGYADFIDEQILKGRKAVSVYTANIAAKKAGYKTVSDRTLYNWIDKGLLKVGKTDLLLTVQRKPSKLKRNKENKRIYGDSIEKRPERVNNREEFGHFEGDSIVGANHKGQIITLVERKIRVGFMFKFDKMDANNIKYVKKILQKRYGDKFYSIFKSITFDNGSEFSHNIKDKKLQVYYAHPYSSYERGSNENFNGIVRRYIKKGRDFQSLTSADIIRINNSINTMPRKILKGKTAIECFYEEIDKIANQ